MATQDQTSNSTTLVSRIGKNSGKPYVAVEVLIEGEGKTWRSLVFLTPFELDYLQKNDDTLKYETSLSSDGSITVTAGDFEKSLVIDSVLERKFVTRVLRAIQQEKAVITQPEDKLNLDDETADETGFLG